MKNRLFSNLGMETIDFQTDLFGREVELFFTGLMSKSKVIADVVKYSDNTVLEAIIRKHTNMKIKVDLLDNKQVPSIIWPKINARHHLFDHLVMSKEWFERPVNEFVNALLAHEGKAGVDSKTGRVFGAFQDVGATMYFPPNYLLYVGFTPREVAALVMHEIGHMFIFFEYFHRSIKTNEVLSYVSRNMTLATPEDVRESIVVKTFQAMGLEISNPKELALECNIPKILMLLSEQSKYYKPSELNSSKYDTTACEQLADQYATRQGLGVDLVTALSKYDPSEMNQNAVVRFARYMQLGPDVGTIIFLTAMATSAAIVSAPFMAAFFGLLSFANAYNMVSDASTEKQNYTYDGTVTRTKRIREQLVAASKKPFSSKERAAELIAGIKTIDEMLKTLSDSKTFFTVVADFVFTKSGDTRKTINLQRQLEELAHNDLFLSAMRLKHNV